MSLMGRWLETSSADFAAELQQLTDWSLAVDEEVLQQVQKILREVGEEGDEAVLRCTRRFDGISAQHLSELEVSGEELSAALASLPGPARDALSLAKERIQDFHRHQKQAGWQFEDGQGNRLAQKITPLDRVGVYVPGGKASYPSTVLMTVIPARVAGVQEINITVPTPGGEVNPAVWAAAFLAGADRVFRVGGAQAIAALACGTETIPKVDKIVGPGNQYVAVAKQLVLGKVGIDMLAGPSEVLVLADDSANPDWVALDLFAQAEHDEQAQPLLLAWDPLVLQKVDAAMQRLISDMPRRRIIEASLRGRGAMILARDLQDAMEVVNQTAPEHLELAIRDTEEALGQLRHAGAVFVGNYSAEVLGDYAAGPSHVLPTGGSARYASGLGVQDFQKRTSIFYASREGARPVAGAAEEIARSEGLMAHAAAARVRLTSESEMTDLS